MPTGDAGAFPAVSPSDVLVDLVYALKAGYRQNASFVMNRKTQAAIRKFKDARRQLSLAAAGERRPAGDADVLPRDKRVLDLTNDASLDGSARLVTFVEGGVRCRAVHWQIPT